MERPRTEPSSGYIEGFSQHVIDTGLITFLGKCRVNVPTLRFRAVCRCDPSRCQLVRFVRAPSFGIARWILKPSSAARPIQVARYFSHQPSEYPLESVKNPRIGEEKSLDKVGTREGQRRGLRTWLIEILNG